MPPIVVTFIWCDGFTLPVGVVGGLAGMYATHPQRLRPVRYRVTIGPGTLTRRDAATLNDWLNRECEQALCNHPACFMKSGAKPCRL